MMSLPVWLPGAMFLPGGGGGLCPEGFCPGGLCLRGLHPGDLCQGDSPETLYTVKSGQYALYWNGFLFYFVIRTAELKTSQNAQIARKVALSGEVCTFSIELTFDLKSFSVGVWN